MLPAELKGKTNSESWSIGTTIRPSPEPWKSGIRAHLLARSCGRQHFETIQGYDGIIHNGPSCELLLIDSCSACSAQVFHCGRPVVLANNVLIPILPPQSRTPDPKQISRRFGSHQTLNVAWASRWGPSTYDRSVATVPWAVSWSHPREGPSLSPPRSPAP